MRETVLDTLDDFERWGDDCAYVFPRGYRHERWSCRRVAGVAYQFARELQARNVGKGDSVLLWSPNCAEWVAAFLGCALCGTIAVPIDDQSSPDFARRISEQVSTRLVLCSSERARIFEKTVARAGTNCGGFATIDPVDLASTLAKHSTERFRPVQIEPADTLEIVFTSGTTAEPKGVVITHGNVIGNIAPIESEITKYLKYEKMVHPIRFLNLLPLSHVFGQFLGVFLPALLGGVVVFGNTFNPAEIIATIRRERVSVLVAVPRMIESLKQKIERDLEDEGREAEFDARYTASASQHFLRRWWTFRDVRRKFGWKFWAMISGGAALDPKTEEFWHLLGYAIIQGYGLTETTSLISLNHPFHTSRGSIGKVLPGREIKLANDGEILVRGSGVARGYWTKNDHALQPVAQSQDEGWYRTGDLGALDERGNLFFKGRKKEVIVTPAGMNVFPEDLEAALRQQKEVQDCIVVGLERGGNAEPCAVLILHEPAPKEPALVAGIVERANEALAEYQRMRSWFVWPDEDFPRSATQKPRRNLIRDAVEAGLRGGPVSDAASPLAELLTRVTGRPRQNLSPESNLQSGLGLSSLERVALVGALEDRYQIDLSENNLAKAITVGDLESLVKGEKGDRGSLHDRSKVDRSDVDRSNAGRSNIDRSNIFHYPEWVLRWPVTWLRLAAHYLLMRPAVFLLARPSVSGTETLDNVSGPLLVVSNHIADVDIGLIQYAIPRRFRHKLATATRGEALEALRSPGSSRVWAVRIYNRVQWTFGVALLNLFPLPQLSGFRKSFAYAGAAVDRGYSVLVFPEGRHSRDGTIGEFQSGVGLLANNLLIPILPIRIDGLFELKIAGKKFASPGKIQVRMGKPMRFAPGTNPEEIARALQNAVQGL
jgi:long-chain acyl-CoA synthetase